MRIALWRMHKGKKVYCGVVYDDVFYHEEGFDETNAKAQLVYKHGGSPGGVPVSVAEYCKRASVIQMRHAVKGNTKKMLVTTLSILMQHGERDVLDGRDSYFLPRDFWTEVPWEKKWKYLPDEINVDEWFKRQPSHLAAVEEAQKEIQGALGL